MKGVYLKMRSKTRGLLAVAIAGGIALTGCSTSSVEGAGVSQKDVKVMKEALATLKATDSYLVQTKMTAPDGNATYLEVVNDGGSYTEYPVDDNGNIVSDTQQKDGGTSENYSLADWLEPDGKIYMVGGTDSEFYKAPDSYGEKLLSRNVGYFDKMVDSFTSIEKEDETVTGDIGDGEEEFTVYKCKLPAEKVKEVMGATTYGLYDSYVDEKGIDKNIKKLCQFYLDDLDMTLTFSDANVTVAMSDGELRQVTLETGGLGTKLYVEKSFLMNAEYDLREKPDFKNAKDYSDSMKDVADYVADFDSYEEAVEALSNTGESTEEAGVSSEESNDTSNK